MLGTVQFIQDYLVRKKDSMGSKINNNDYDINFIATDDQACRIERDNPQGKFLLMLFKEIIKIPNILQFAPFRNIIFKYLVLLCTSYI